MIDELLSYLLDEIAMDGEQGELEREFVFIQRPSRCQCGLSSRPRVDSVRTRRLPPAILKCSDPLRRVPFIFGSIMLGVTCVSIRFVLCSLPNFSFFDSVALARD
jgi:hypothetical protein